MADPRMRRLKKALEHRPMASNRPFEVEFTENKHNIALWKGKTGKALGLNELMQEMLAHLGQSVKDTLLTLFNHTRRSGELLHAWRLGGCCTKILKKGKCAMAAESYRPISLTSVISKTMEYLVNAPLYH
ncbi:endonuclease/exonuclease/phosphatase [Plakobranchus ocellatus]|uniref:Endonuclease/exonuclease/phosphatase n=1 Tax=Plakobranchus ocellatus TaxID=259542 RepID=A0AAV3XY10_9GAST|nr:endonuclease/exonuclease/phosphatase [Plakobranchus ocellatus]